MRLINYLLIILFFTFSSVLSNDQQSFIQWKDNFKKIPFETTESSGKYTYDSRNRILRLDTSDNNIENQTYSFKYKKNKTKISRVTNSTPDIEYHFNYDKRNNPIQEKRFIYLNGKKYLDTEITMQISYFK